MTVSLRTPARGALVSALLIAAVSAFLLSLAGPATAATPAQETAKVSYTACTPAPVPANPAVVISGVRVAKMGCALGKTVTLAYTTCRLANGATGRCVKKVRGFACFEIRNTSPDGSFSAQVTCSKGEKKVRHSYRQAAA